MKAILEKLSTEFIVNRDTVKEAFKGCHSAVYAVCANLFCARGRIADRDRLSQCRKIITEQTQLFSRFRGKLSPILSCLLALEKHPEEKMALALEYDHLLKQSFNNTEYLVLTAFLLTESGEKDLVTEKIERGKALYRRMDKEHPILANDMDSVFAVMLDAFLKTQKGYGSGEEKERAMHAVMIVSDQYTCNSQVNSAVMTNTLEMLIAKQRALYTSLFLQTLQIAAQFLSAMSEETEGKSETEANPSEGSEEQKGEA